MARVLLVWELGGELSHLANLEMIARVLAEQGHELGVALRELQEAPRFFPEIRLQFYQAPFKQGRAPELSEHSSYAHMLYTSGFADPRELLVQLSAWVGIFDAFRPDLIVFDHSPTGLLASARYPVARVLVGSGFLVPPLATPLGVFPGVPRRQATLRALQADEDAVLAVANRAVAALGMERLARLSDVYAPVDEEILLTFPELDPFGERKAADYHGVWSTGTRPAPAWPAEGSERAFAYLANFPGAEILLRDLVARGVSVLAYAPALPAPVREALAGPSLRFSDELVSLDAVAHECDLFVSHGAHTSVAHTLLGGVPQLLLPRLQDQLFTARRVRELGAGCIADPGDTSFRAPLEALFGDGSYRDAARRFAERHRSFDPASSRAEIAAKLSRLLA